VKTPAAKLELEFSKMLNTLQPRPEVAKEFPKIAARIWNEKQSEMEKSKGALRKQLTIQQSLQDGLMEKYIANKITDEVYRRYSSEYEGRIAELKAELRLLDQNADTLEGFIQFAELALIDVAEVWEGASVEDGSGFDKLSLGTVWRVLLI
jgi:hypothetical protein